jgi:hypothetical protein
VLPIVAIVGALAVAVVFLPSILRPPPEVSTDSAALNPDAPPDDQSEQVIQSNQQAKGGGAGATQGPGQQTGGGSAPPESTTTLTTAPRPPAFSQCFGNPGRQTESVYSAPCAPAFSGNNGGATGHNVFPNEVRIGFWHSLGTPAEGPVSETPPPNESSQHRTMRVLMQYVNTRFQTWGRKVKIYGLTGDEDPAKSSAIAEKADSEFKIFGAYHLYRPFCETIIRRGGVMICNPQTHAAYTRNRPGFFSWMIEYEQAQAFGAELMCKQLIGKPAKFAGTGVSGIRKFGWIGQYDANNGVPASTFNGALKSECGAEVPTTFEVQTDSAPEATAAAMTQMRQQGVTTVVLNLGIVNATYAMSAADSLGWYPEWVIFSPFGTDINIIGNLLPKNQTQHLFGFSGWEIPRTANQTECYQAYRSIDPSNTPDATTCGNFWHPLMLMMDGIQEAGPNLNQKSFDQALLRLGRRYPPEPWAVGGGFGPEDYSYMDNVGLIWFDANAIDPGTNAPGAYRWTFKGTRFKRGQIPADDSQLFVKGVNTPGAPDS